MSHAPWTRRRLLRAVVLVVVAAVLVVHFVPRPAFLPLASQVDGPEISHAKALLVFLHGRGGSLRQAKKMATRLRSEGLPADVSILLVEAPYPTWFGHHWGDSSETQARSRAGVRALLATSRLPPERVVVAGFSQGAGMALDLAVEDPRIGGVASFSPCASWLRGELPKRDRLRVLLAHGRRDAVCPVEESRSLARVLEIAKRPAQYIEFDGPHTVPPEAVRALVELATRQ